MSKYQLVKLGDDKYFKRFGGGTPKKNMQEYWEGGKIPWLSNSELADGKINYISHTEKTITKEGLKKSSASLIPAKSVLLTCTASIGKVAINEIDLCTNQQFNSFQCSEEFVPEYLAFFFLTISDKLESIAGKTSFLHITISSLNGIEVPLPPLHIQKRIVAILERAEQLKEKRAQANKNTQSIIQSLFYDMFGDVRVNDRGWPEKKWDDVLKIINGKNQKSVQNPNGKYLIYGSGGIMGRADDYLVSGDSVVLGRKGNINKPIKVRTKYWNVDTAFGIVPKENEITCDYLFCFCELFNFEALNTSTTIPSLTKSNLLALEMPVPPFDLQQEFSKKVQHIERLQEKQNNVTTDVNNLFESLLQKAFKGELVA